MPRTMKPRSASVMAISRPMPWLAPVTTAIFIAPFPSISRYETASQNLMARARHRQAASYQGIPAVDANRLSVDVARLRGAEEGDDACDLLGRADALRRHLR